MNLPSKINLLNTQTFKYTIPSKTSPGQGFEFGFYGKDHPNRTEIKQQGSCLNQVHGTNIIECIDDLEQPADGVTSSSRNKILYIKTADCLPILSHTPDRGIGAFHAGWRGLAGGILREFYKRLDATQVQQTQLVFGPCIGIKHFEVGEEVVKEFAKSWPKKELDSCIIHKEKPNLNLPKLAVFEALRLGFQEQNIFIFDSCTFENDLTWFSYRREKPHKDHNLNWIKLL